MQRILFWLGLLFLANWWWRKQSRAGVARMRERAEQARTATSATGARPQAAPRQLAEPMARCEVCGVYIPISEAVQAGDRHFCSAGHARQATDRA
jgi:uncharacterized protein